MCRCVLSESGEGGGGEGGVRGRGVRKGAVAGVQQRARMGGGAEREREGWGGDECGVETRCEKSAMAAAVVKETLTHPRQ